MPQQDNEPGFATASAAETAFYTAFANCDVQAMNAVWSNTEVICVHPGSMAIVGRDAVMRSWINILSQAEPPNLQIKLLSRTESDGLAIHLVEEHISPIRGAAEAASVVLATNIYCLEKDGWHLLQHHASLPNPRQITH